MGKPVTHLVRSGEKVVLPAYLLRRKTGKLCIKGGCSEDPVKRKIFFLKEVNPVGRHGRNPAPARKSVGVSHLIARREFYKQILHLLPLQSFEEPFVIRKDDETFPMFLQSADEIELLVTMPVRDKPAKVRVSVKVLHQEDGPAFAVD
jgi:hypothetical protein